MAETRRNMSPFAVARVRSIDILILDEISMISAELLDKLDELFRLVRGKTSPFGGIQMIFAGDFLQLAPFEKPKQRGAAAPPAQRVGFAFESKVWRECIPIDRVISLTKVHRQNGDKHGFIQYGNAQSFRFGCCRFSHRACRLFLEC